MRPLSRVCVLNFLLSFNSFPPLKWILSYFAILSIFAFFCLSFFSASLFLTLMVHLPAIAITVLCLLFKRYQDWRCIFMIRHSFSSQMALISHIDRINENYLNDPLTVTKQKALQICGLWNLSFGFSVWPSATTTLRSPETLYLLTHCISIENHVSCTPIAQVVLFCQKKMLKKSNDY